MSLHFLDNRRQIEGVYRKLETVREQINSLLTARNEYATADNLNILELEEDSLLARIVKLKNLI